MENEALAALPRFPSLRTFWPRRLSEDGFRHVGRCTALEAFAFPPGATDAATRHIANLPRLKTLSVAGTAITDRSLKILAQLQSLETLDVHGCVGITDNGISLLSALPRLAVLSVYECPQVTATGTAALPPRIRIRASGD